MESVVKSSAKNKSVFTVDSSLTGFWEIVHSSGGPYWDWMSFQDMSFSATCWELGMDTGIEGACFLMINVVNVIPGGKARLLVPPRA